MIATSGWPLTPSLAPTSLPSTGVTPAGPTASGLGAPGLGAPGSLELAGSPGFADVLARIDAAAGAIVEPGMARPGPAPLPAPVVTIAPAPTPPGAAPVPAAMIPVAAAALEPPAPASLDPVLLDTPPPVAASAPTTQSADPEPLPVDPLGEASAHEKPEPPGEPLVAPPTPDPSSARTDAPPLQTAQPTAPAITPDARPAVARAETTTATTPARDTGTLRPAATRPRPVARREKIATTAALSLATPAAPLAAPAPAPASPIDPSAARHGAPNPAVAAAPSAAPQNPLAATRDHGPPGSSTTTDPVDVIGVSAGPGAAVPEAAGAVPRPHLGADTAQPGREPVVTAPPSAAVPDAAVRPPDPGASSQQPAGTAGVLNAGFMPSGRDDQPAAPTIVAARPGRFGAEMGVAIAHHAVAGKPETITVRLDPKDLGRIEVRLSFDGAGTLRAVVTADTPGALEMLRRESGDLGRALADAGLRSDAQSLRFDTRTPGGNDPGQRQPGADPRQPQTRQRRADTEYQGFAETPIYRPLRTSGRVDLTA
ncbi:flagellar hook-length control protein FliK [Sphingomonas sp. CFBP9019]|uniref:flagellar hook-length control protein FliK n=1 Tax=Sphingomonas sp. CFBP9019 TaxID=3096532 RepID=UPI002A6A6474|nr:flagellar hook-length control protein FliK [Sphingomonas sp. CFBP9019]MDY1009913.1 flagellar hook-length control protein FliK [Sphingomonas sp. CFBP9019]